MKRMRHWSRSNRTIAVGAIAALTASFGAAYGAVGHLPIETHRVSVSSTGAEANARAEDPVISGDGRYVLFLSEASNLVPDDTNGAIDVFVHDRLTRETIRASVGATGQETRFGADGGSLSRNGRYAVFYSSSPDLVEGDTNGRTDVFRKDLVTGAVELVSIAADGSGVDASALVSPSVHSISDNGRYVVYLSRATNIVPGVSLPASGNHVYVRDMETDTTELVSVDNEGRPGMENAQTPSISGNGHVAFFETRSPLDPADTNGLMSVYARDHINDRTELVSANNSGETANDHSWRPRANFDGSLVVFDSTAATNLVPRDQGGISPDVYLRDLDANRTEKVSVSSSGAPPNEVAHRGSIGGDGRFVAYWTSATNHVPEKSDVEDDFGDVYIRDRILGYTELVSIPAGGGFGSTTSQSPSLSADALAVSFMSAADNLVPNDTNGTTDVFARQIGPSIGFVGQLDAAVGDDELQIEGIARATGALLAHAEDPDGDLVGGENLSDRVGDISSLGIAYRRQVEQELLFRVGFHNLPFPVLQVAQPGTTYSVSFRVDGVRHEIRMNAAEDIAFYPRFDLFVCDPVCILVGETPGGFGTIGHEIHFTTSLDDIGGAVGSEISEVRAFAGIGGSPTGAAGVLDEASAPSIDVPHLEAAIGLARIGTSPEDADLFPVDAPDQAVFSATLPLTDIAPGEYEAVARLCIGNACGFGSSPVTVGGTEVTATELSLVLRQVRGDVVASAVLRSVHGEVLAGREVVFFLNGAEWQRAVTDGDGAGATIFHRSEIKKGDVVEAVFSGDAILSSSRASAVMDARPPNAV